MCAPPPDTPHGYTVVSGLTPSTPVVPWSDTDRRRAPYWSCGRPSGWNTAGGSCRFRPKSPGLVTQSPTPFSSVGGSGLCTLSARRTTPTTTLGALPRSCQARAPRTDSLAPRPTTTTPQDLQGSRSPWLPLWDCDRTDGVVRRGASRSRSGLTTTSQPSSALVVPGRVSPKGPPRSFVLLDDTPSSTSRARLPEGPLCVRRSRSEGEGGGPTVSDPLRASSGRSATPGSGARSQPNAHLAPPCAPRAPGTATVLRP